MSQAIAFKKSDPYATDGRGSENNNSDTESGYDQGGGTLASSYMPAGSLRPGRPTGDTHQRLPPKRPSLDDGHLDNSINGEQNTSNVAALSGSQHYDRHGQLRAGAAVGDVSTTNETTNNRVASPTQSPKLLSQRTPSGQLANHSLASQSSHPSSINVEPLKLKIVVIGDYSVGKSSLIRQLTQRLFNLQSMATIGVEFKEYHSFVTMNTSNNNNNNAPGGGMQRLSPPTPQQQHKPNSSASTAPPTPAPNASPSPTRGSANHALAASFAYQQPVTAQIWDIAGQQYCSSMTKQYYRGSSCAVVVADVSRPSTFDVTLEWRDDFLAKAGADALQSSAELLEKLGAKNPNSSKTSRASRILSRASSNNNIAGGSSPSSPNTDYQLTAEEQELFRLPVFLIGNKVDLLPPTARGPFGGGLSGTTNGPSNQQKTNMPTEVGYGGETGASSPSLQEGVESSARLGMGASSIGDEPFVSERAVHEFAKQKQFADSFVVSAKDFDSVSSAFHSIIQQLADRRANQDAHKAALSAATGAGSTAAGGRSRGESVMLHNRNKKDEPIRPKKKKDCEC